MVTELLLILIGITVLIIGGYIATRTTLWPPLLKPERSFISLMNVLGYKVIISRNLIETYTNWTLYVKTWRGVRATHNTLSLVGKPRYEYLYSQTGKINQSENIIGIVLKTKVVDLPEFLISPRNLPYANKVSHKLYPYLKQFSLEGKDLINKHYDLYARFPKKVQAFLTAEFLDYLILVSDLNKDVGISSRPDEFVIYKLSPEVVTSETLERLNAVASDCWVMLHPESRTHNHAAPPETIISFE